MLRHDTIVAVSSAPGTSARGLLRLSGSSAFDAIDRVRDETHPPISRQRGLQPFRLYLGCPAILLTFPAPGSYTGEDSAELQLPGNPALLDRVVSMLVERGARRAEPGEFTARAYLNGKMSLTEAEGVAATITAASDAELRAARFMTDGRLGTLAAHLSDRLAGALALVEAGIDFTDQEDVVAITPADLLERLTLIEAELNEVMERATGLDELRAIPHVVLAGPPNAGKSTLFNALLGRTRAVVSAVSGTTRDVLAEPLPLTEAPDSPEIMLHDAAGFDPSDDEMNQRMQQALNAMITRADLVILLHPPGTMMTTTPHRGRPTLAIRSRADERNGTERTQDDQAGVLSISVTDKTDLNNLRTALASQLANRTTTHSADALALQPRHEAAIKHAAEHLHTAIQRVQPMKSQRSLDQIELIAADLRLALDQLGELTGELTPDDVLGRVFASFCVGK